MLNEQLKNEDFHFIIDKLNSRFASWKNELLNKAGRITMANSVLTSIPNYCMQISWFLQEVCTATDKIVRGFIWKGTANSGSHLVDWHKITRTKKGVVWKFVLA